MNERNGIVILFIVAVGMIFLNPNKASLEPQADDESAKAKAYFEKVFQVPWLFSMWHHENQLPEPFHGQVFFDGDSY